MALYVPVDVTSDEEKQFAIGYRPLPIATNEQESYRFERDQHLRPDSSIDTRNGSFVKDFLIATETHYEKIRSGEFSFNNPWLPTNALKLLNKMKGVALTEKELVRLMELVAERACVHFQLTEGRFVAMTFFGRIVEVSDTRISLLKKIQGRKYREPIFVWRIGSKAFSGRI